MVTQILPFLLAIGAAVGERVRETPACRYIPGDAGWPSQKSWTKLNSTVGGRLIATVPIAHVCHSAGAFSAYNEASCAELKQSIQTAGAATLCVIPHLTIGKQLKPDIIRRQPQPGEPMNPYFYNLTCSPFTPIDQPCDLGDRPVYSINVSGHADVQAGLEFARKNNIRLVIKNTGLE